MKCQKCKGKGLVIGYGDPLVDECVRWDGCSKCGGKGWRPFWTPSERAGLKSLGLSYCLSRDFGGDREDEVVAEVIIGYVSAARKEKEK